MPPGDATDALLARAGAGDRGAVGELFELYRPRLARLLGVRLDRRLAGRFGADDVLQEAFLDVARRLPEYLADPAVPFFVWLRFLALQRLQMIERAHLGAAMRAAGREQAVGGSASADDVAGALAGRFTSPTEAARRSELQEQLRAALAAMEPLDRELVALRHFEELGNAEAAAVLGLTKDAASKRYVRALRRLREALGET